MHVQHHLDAEAVQVLQPLVQPRQVLRVPHPLFRLHPLPEHQQPHEGDPAVHQQLPLCLRQPRIVVLVSLGVVVDVHPPVQDRPPFGIDPVVRRDGWTFVLPPLGDPGSLHQGHRPRRTPRFEEKREYDRRPPDNQHHTSRPHRHLTAEHLAEKVPSGDETGEMPGHLGVFVSARWGPLGVDGSREGSRVAPEGMWTVPGLPGPLDSGAVHRALGRQGLRTTRPRAPWTAAPRPPTPPTTLATRDRWKKGKAGGRGWRRNQICRSAVWPATERGHPLQGPPPSSLLLPSIFLVVACVETVGGWGAAQPSKERWAALLSTATARPGADHPPPVPGARTAASDQ